MRALIDTCVIIDALQEREPFNEDAKEIFRAAAFSSFNAYITAKSLSDVYYLMRKFTHDEQRTRDVLRKLCALFELLDTNAEDCIRALSSSLVDYEDAIMAESAARAAVSFIVTRNTKDFLSSKIPPLTPKEFLNTLR